MSASRSAGDRSTTSIDPDRIARLNAGEIEAATLAECLAVDFAALMASVLPEIGNDAVSTMKEAATTGISRRMPLAARLIRDRFGLESGERLAGHSSDTARGWASFIVGTAEPMALDVRLGMIRRFADDRHFGVREWSWMAVRPHLAVEPEKAIALLSCWTSDPSELIRRFASEAMRPRGVWCAHLPTLKQKPELALPVLEPLRSDPSRYVQDSVGNWLNDAGKDRPDWTRAVCERWLAESPSPETKRICQRALRSIQSRE